VTAQTDWAEAANDGSATDATCPVPGCGKVIRHRGKHANQGSKPKPSAQFAAEQQQVNGQLVRITLTVPLSELLKVAIVESADVG
jgi:hypothetical protein